MTTLLGAAALGVMLPPSRAFAADEPLVYVGKDGWLFPGWEHETGIPAGWVDAGLNNILKARDVLAKNGIKLFVSIVPSKGRVYSEFLPPTVVPTAEFMGRYHHALDFFSKNAIPCANLLDPMLAAKSQNLQFMKTDSHWTNYGCDLSATLTAKNFGIPAAPPKPLPAGVWIPGGTTELDVAGDLVPLLPAAQQGGYKKDPFLVRDYTLTGGAEPKNFNIVGRPEQPQREHGISCDVHAPRLTAGRPLLEVWLDRTVADAHDVLRARQEEWAEAAEESDLADERLRARRRSRSSRCVGQRQRVRFPGRVARGPEQRYEELAAGFVSSSNSTRPSGV